MKDSIDAAAKKRFLLFHLGLCAVAALIYGVKLAFEHLPAFLTGCGMHDFLHLYCPVCGGTRCVTNLLLLKWKEALDASAYVFFLAFVALVLDAVALCRLIKGKQKLSVMPSWGYILLAAGLFVFAIVRNILLVCCGLDPLGDLLPFWNP